MAIRVRKDGTMICAAHSQQEDGDTYIDDGLHYEMSQVHGVITSHPMPEHVDDPRWWWSSHSGPTEAQAEIARLQDEVERTNDVLESQAHVIRDLKAEVDRLRGLEVDTYNTWKLAIAKSTDTAWNDAIEGAADLFRWNECDFHTSERKRIAAAIRALKRPT